VLPSGLIATALAPSAAVTAPSTIVLATLLVAVWITDTVLSDSVRNVDLAAVRRDRRAPRP
jgi:hypothetical protein